MNAVTNRKKTVPESQGIRPLARELASSYRTSIEYQKKKMGLSNAEAVAKAEEPSPPEYRERLRDAPPDQIHFYDLEELTRDDPNLAVELWTKMQEEALEELRSGHRAARVMEGYFADAWKRAQFLAVRRELSEEWQPHNGVERQLIDTMAQAQTAMFFWQERLTLRSSTEPIHEQRDIEARGGWTPPRVSDVQAIDQAAGMVDRFNKIFLRTLRALRDLRRYAPAIVFKNAGQVNVAGQQLNLSAGEEFERWKTI